VIIFTLFRNSKTNSQYNLFFRKSYRITDIPGNGLISVSYILFLSLLWKFDDATLYRVRDLDYISRHCIYFTISGKYWRKQNKSEGSWCRVKSILPYACDIKKYELILVLRIRIFVRVERHVCLRTRTHFENKVQHDPIYGFIPATLLCLSQVSISRIVDHHDIQVYMVAEKMIVREYSFIHWTIHS
jgi:hypothetical protein